MKGIITLVFGLILSSAHAATISKPCGAHTWHRIFSQSGSWHVTLKMINEYGYFLDKTCRSINESSVNAAQPLHYGFGYLVNSDFDIAYTVTVVNDEPSFESKSCVFVVTAKGPAKPDIHTISYNGAKCEWKNNGSDFVVG